MLYPEDAEMVSNSAGGLAKMMTVIVDVFAVFEVAGLTVSAKKTEAVLLRKPYHTTLAPQVALE